MPQYSEWTVGPLSSATCSPMFMQFTDCYQPVQRSLAERMVITCVMRHAWTHKRQMSGPTVHSYTMTMLNNIVVKIEQCPPPPPPTLLHLVFNRF